ncbi:Stabilin-like protein [Emericellopsis cladophorae]|uniref:Stabilin-like protein n=1 Tax=Emericellopsis cladophorae TaxID=2686198 RepID=A0A9P9Y3X6_9HYPO|nr:Stabilin-like protein [Emericellopsis cladophorae]KAI6782655.1 Stabilin-like protein [Emericellopsis cladophorae]
MKFTPFLASGAAAMLIVPGSSANDEPQAPISLDHGEASNFWDRLAPAADAIESAIEDSIDFLTSGFETVKETVGELQEEFQTQLDDAVQAVDDHHHHHPPKHDTRDHTIYELISKSNYTKIFAKIVDEHPDVVKLLNSTHASHNLTLFVPIDEAFEHIPDDHEKPSKEFVEALLQYHVGIGEYPAKRILSTDTIPTAYNEEWLGGEPQRLRVGLGLGGVNLNFYSRVVAVDIGAKNGVVHGIRSILVPPPMIGRILTLFPGEFSTLLLAYEKTEFVKFIHGVKMVGSTVFAPSNRAFSSLGPRVNAFLFNTETGLKYLKALLKYHIVANVTLYTDAVYDKTDGEAKEQSREHFDLKTLLGDAHIGVDTATFAGFTVIKVNGFANVVRRDAPGKNGVIHVLDKVLIPPRKHGEESLFEEIFEELTVEDLMERLDEFVEDGENPNELEL